MSNALQASTTTLPYSAPSAHPEATVLGIRIHGLRLPEAVAAIEGTLSQRRCHQVILANAHTVSACWKDYELRRAVENAELVLADGMSVVWGGRWIGIRLPERVAGPDLTEALCQRARDKGYRVFFLGSSPETLELLRVNLLQRWPGLIIAGLYSPPMCAKLSSEENEKIRAAVAAAKPDILFVGMSMPKQEKWIAQQKDLLNVPIALGVGAAFDFLAGRIPRAPESFRRHGFEWLYRLAREPRRLWRRYLLGNAIFLTHLLWASLRHRLRH